MEEDTANPRQPARILIADDNVEVRKALRLIIEREALAEVIGEVASVEAMHAIAPTFAPTVLLVDLELQHLEPHLIASVRAQCPGIRVIGLTSRAEPQDRLSPHLDGLVNQLDGPRALLDVLHGKPGLTASGSAK